MPSSPDIKIVVGADINASVSSIKSSLEGAFKSSPVKIKVDAGDTAAFKKTLENVKIDLSNITINSSSISNLSAQISNAISNTLGSVSTSALNGKSGTGGSSVSSSSGSNKKDTSWERSEANVRYSNLSSEVSKYKSAISKLVGNQVDSTELARAKALLNDMQVTMDNIKINSSQLSVDELNASLDTAEGKFKTAISEMQQMKTISEGLKVSNESKGLQSYSNSVGNKIEKLKTNATGSEQLALDNLSDVYSRLQVGLKELASQSGSMTYDAFSQESSYFRDMLSAVDAALEKISAARKEVQSLSTLISTTDASKIVDFKDVKSGSSQIASQIKNLQKNISVDSGTGVIPQTEIKQVEELSAKYKEFRTQLELFDKNKSKYSQSEYDSGLANLKKLLTEIIQLEKEATQAQQARIQSNAKDADTTEVRNKEAEADAVAKVTAEYNKLGEARSSMKSDVKSLSSFEGMSSELQSQIATLTQQQEAFEVQYQKLTELKKIASASGDYTTYNDEFSKTTQQAEQLRNNINKVTESYKLEAQAAAEAATQAAKEANVSEEKRLSALEKVQTLLGKVKKAQLDWTAAADSASTKEQYTQLGKYKTQLEELDTAFRKGSLSVDEYETKLSELKTINVGFNDITASIKDAGKAHKSLFSSLAGLGEKFTRWFSVSQVVMHGVMYARQAVEAVIEIDTAMTELKKVTDETSTAYDNFLTNAGTRAKELGSTVSDVVTATADFARLGYDLDDASTLADAAIVYKNVGDGIEDISTASESVISTMQAFGVEASDAMSIVDKFNEVGNNYAISSEGIGEAMLRSSSALASANNTLDESIAMAAAMNTQLQDPDVTGTTLKTLSMYLRAAKTEAEEAGESTDGMADSVSELREDILALTGGQVDIQLDEDTFKSTYQIMKELSEVWDQLTDVSQANILEMVGGKFYRDVQKCA